VKWHKANIYRKLGVSGSRLAVERAVDLGILDADDLP
jgi:DNA-binding CsgD family transcriptional regulator